MTPSEELFSTSFQQKISILQVTYKKAVANFQQAHKEMTTLEEQTIKALMGENSIDVSVINAMMPKYKENQKTQVLHPVLPGREPRGPDPAVRHLQPGDHG